MGVIHRKLNTSSNNHFSEGSLLYFWPFLLSQPFGSNLAQYTALPAGLNCKSNFFCEVFGSKRLIIGWFFPANIPFPAQIVDLQRPKLLPNYCFFGHLVACWPVAFVFANGCLLTTTAYNSTIAHLSLIYYSVGGKKARTIKNTQQSKVNQTTISVSTSSSSFGGGKEKEKRKLIFLKRDTDTRALKDHDTNRVWTQKDTVIWAGKNP